MDSRHLANFLAVFDYGSVTRAAEALYIAQPALSQSLRALEDELGVALFRRTPKGMSPTGAGQALVGPARQVLASTSEIDRLMASLRTLHRGRLTLACPTTLAEDPAVALVARYRSDYPGLVVDIREPDPGESVATMLLLGKADLGIDLLPHHEPRLADLTLGSREAVLALAPGVEFAGTEIDPQAAADLPLVCGASTSALRADLEAWFAAAGCAMTIAVETDLEDHLHRFIASGAGSGFIPADRAAAATQQGLRVVSPRPRLRHDFGLLWLTSSASRAAQAMVDQARATTNRNQDAAIR
ncbi:LysR family transcriptional regulator [Demetria terragena]|uniref:LysR family transcriptional regulator n=1 Tax=Demetria terragena TaxID=63959 RepID=UPI00037C0B57|nr:LysR family transcriptional regulator [Demetria terragena]